MVSFMVISEYSGGPDPGDRVKIGVEPLYPLDRVRTLAADPRLVRSWTKKVANDVLNLNWSEVDVAELLAELQPHQYIDSEWCSNGFGAWAACDAYAVRRREWVKTANKNMNMVYFVKFAIGKTGALILLVSCHVSN
jgi:hypothetical protein